MFFQLFKNQTSTQESKFPTCRHSNKLNSTTRESHTSIPVKNGNYGFLVRQPLQSLETHPQVRIPNTFFDLHCRQSCQQKIRVRVNLLASTLPTNAKYGTPDTRDNVQYKPNHKSSKTDAYDLSLGWHTAKLVNGGLSSIRRSKTLNALFCLFQFFL